MIRRRVTYPAGLKWVLAIGVILFAVLNWAFPLPMEAARNMSPVVKDQQGRWLSGFTVEDGTWRVPADISEIDPRFIDQLIAIEDKRFWRHSGVDVPAIFRAARSWTQAGQPVSGASTLTMQLVRQIEPRPRTFRSKVIESLRAVQYEIWLSKSDILELYLTHVPYGGSIEGVYAASLAYFGKPPYQLTQAEIALLIALPQAPESRRPDLRPKASERGRNVILDKLVTAAKLTPLQAKEAREDSVIPQRQAFPETAWITAHGLSRLGIENSTLNIDLQRDIETLTTNFVKAIDDQVNTAVTIVDNRTMSVRAHIASADRTRPGGWIDMSDRARSPGSTLKPFVYGLAMDDGVIAPGSFIEDAPTRFGTYQPENFNRRYHGDVRIHEALRHSLNVPAVAILDQIGGQRLETTLTSAGIDMTRLGATGESAGLALALGGTGITVNDLAVLYAALANGGVAQTLRWSQADSPQSKRIMSEATAQDITQMLRQAPTPAGRVPAWLSQNAPPIAYKTGTSYGFRDAWAAGYTDDWTVIVWVGRPDGAPRNGQTGRLAAAPLLYDIFARLPHSASDFAYSRDEAAPRGLNRVQSSLSQGPQILFPPDGAELLAMTLGDDGRGFALTARSDQDGARFYVNGEPVTLSGRQQIWYPKTAGFYKVSAIDGQGREAVSRVEVITLN